MTLRNLVSIVKAEPTLEIAGTAHNAIAALQQVRDTRPDVVIMDLYLPGDFDGVEAIRRICNLMNPPAIIATTKDRKSVV